MQRCRGRLASVEFRIRAPTWISLTRSTTLDRLHALLLPRERNQAASLHVPSLKKNKTSYVQDCLLLYAQKLTQLPKNTNDTESRMLNAKCCLQLIIELSTRLNRTPSDVLWNWRENTPKVRQFSAVFFSRPNVDLSI